MNKGWVYITIIVILTLLLIASSIISFTNIISYQSIKDLCLNFISEIFGIALVVFFINRLFELNKQRQKNKIFKVAFSTLSAPLRRIIRIFFQIYKSCLREKPKNTDLSFKLFSEDRYFRTIKDLYFSKKAPYIILPDRIHQDWYNYMYDEFDSLRNLINNLIQKYSSYFDIEHLELLEEINSSHFVNILGFLIRIKRTQGINGDDNFLSIDDFLLFFKEYVSSINKLVCICNKYNEDDQIKLETSLWNNSKAPKIGSNYD